MNGQNYKVSICVPVYGAEKYIERCAKSLFEQTYDNIEYVFVDDCSLDYSFDVLSKVIDKYPNRKDSVKIVHHKENKGIAAARNTCIESCTGQFLTFVDADDWIENDTIECLVNKQKEDDYDIVSAYAVKESRYNHSIMRQPMVNTPEKFNLELLSRKYAWVLWGRMIRTILFQKYDIRCKQGINVGEDALLVIRLFYFSKKVITIEKPLYHYSLNVSSITHEKFSKEKVATSFAFIREMDDFLNDKPKQYKDAFNKAKIMEYCRLRIGAYRDTITPPECLRDINAAIDRIPSACQQQLSLPYRLTLRLKNKYMLLLYIKFAALIKHLVKAI